MWGERCVCEGNENNAIEGEWESKERNGELKRSSM